jgi:hypothetical protein
MIGEFLKAELHSSRFREGTLKALKMLGLTESVIENPDYENKKHNEQRAKILHLTRGWPDEWLFTGFPANTMWALCTLTKNELLSVFRLKSSLEMTDEERLLSHTAEMIEQNRKKNKR